MKPTKVELAAAYDRTIPDVVAPGLRVLFVGINPGLYSAATATHFGRPGNRFWPALHRSGFTERQLHPTEQHDLLAAGLGITNVVARATARADELTPAEIVAGGVILTEKITRLAPQWVAILGIGAYRTAFGFRNARIGPQLSRLGGAHTWVLPNPSGLNAHFTLPALTDQFTLLREATGHPTPP